MSVAAAPLGKTTSGDRQRYHDLDAFRAWAVLLGIVLHAAWLMLPYQMAVPIVDSDHSRVTAWLFSFIHLFRMQAFFLVAGFFGNLVYQRKGLRAFCHHRFARIVVPLVVGWIVLVPWMLFYYAWGELLSGASLANESPWQRYRQNFSAAFEQRFPLVHLWFLFDLILLYVATLSVKAALDHVIDRTHAFRTRVSLLFGALMRSPANVLWLAIPSALLLLPMKYWIGIEGYPSWLLPDWHGFLGYWLFFAVGWFLYDQPNLLGIFGHRWRAHLFVGFLLSFPIWGLYEYQIRPYLTFAYPALTSSEVRDYPAFRKALLAASQRPTDGVAGEVWQRFPSAWQARVRRDTPLTPNESAGLAKQLTMTVILGEPLESASTVNAVGPESAFENRHMLEAAFPGSIATQFKSTPGVLRLKAVYSFLYAIGMWTLVFGFLGFFQHAFANPSPALRYISDSSYWLYLLHLPIMFWIAMYVAPIRMSVVGKFIFYNLATIAILLPSYHYLVRSTFIGRTLNGRTFPFQPFLQSDLFRWGHGGKSTVGTEAGPAT